MPQEIERQDKDSFTDFFCIFVLLLVGNFSVLLRTGVYDFEWHCIFLVRSYEPCPITGNDVIWLASPIAERDGRLFLMKMVDRSGNSSTSDVDHKNIHTAIHLMIFGMW